MESIRCELLIIGAGVVGLAVGRQLSSRLQTVLIEEKAQFGQETSSRNSEVIHSGIYYPKDSNKTKWCIEGRHRIYEFAQKYQVPHKKLGKWVVATSPEEAEYLDRLKTHSESQQVPCRFVDLNKEQEPLVEVQSALFFPESGIIDSHQYMACLEQQFLEKGGLLAYNHRLLEIQSEGTHWRAEVQSPEGTLSVVADVVVNAAGLAAAEISGRALKSERYQHRFCRGRYFMLPPSFQNGYQHLIYPVPQKDGLGIHVTVDIEGQARLGPDVDWCESHTYQDVRQWYDCDWETVAPQFQKAVGRYSKQAASASLTPGQIGIRPKLFIDGSAHRDFWVENCKGFVHCLGIESPGLTASLPIAEEVEKQLGF